MTLDNILDEIKKADTIAILVHENPDGDAVGSALAMVISYTTWKSVGWAIFHGLLSWGYVIYFVLRY